MRIVVLPPDGLSGRAARVLATGQAGKGRIRCISGGELEQWMRAACEQMQVRDAARGRSGEVGGAPGPA